MSTNRQERRALIVVDVQGDFTEGGSLAVVGGKAVARAIGLWIRDAADRYALKVASADRHIDPGGHFDAEPDFEESFPEHCVAGTPGAEFDVELIADRPDLDRPEDLFDVVVTKGHYSAAFSAFEGVVGQMNLEQILTAHSVTHIDVVGIATTHCVKATGLDGLARGFDTTIVTDLAVGITPAQAEEALRELEAAGAHLATTTEITAGERTPA